jgi:ABC-type nickel/cobalt efflux system permease component RcnA
MQTILSIQHWLYSGMSEGLGAFAGGDPRAILLALTAAILFGAVHALMPGHGKTVLVSIISARGAALSASQRRILADTSRACRRPRARGDSP